MPFPNESTSRAGSSFLKAFPPPSFLSLPPFPVPLRAPSPLSTGPLMKPSCPQQPAQSASVRAVRKNHPEQIGNVHGILIRPSAPRSFRREISAEAAKGHVEEKSSFSLPLTWKRASRHQSGQTGLFRSGRGLLRSPSRGADICAAGTNMSGGGETPGMRADLDPSSSPNAAAGTFVRELQLFSCSLGVRDHRRL